MDRKALKQRFVADVKDHKLTVLLDNGLHRHLTLSRADSNCYHYHITTWPGYLAISGDMGCWVFCRLTDMFDFFRRGDGELGINPGYWAEKLHAYDRQGEWEDFDADRLQKVVKEYFDEWVEINGVPSKVAKQAWQDLKGSVLTASNEFEAHTYLRDYEFRGHDTKEEYHLEFQDSWEFDLKTPRFHFLWCCFAIVHAIALYDAEKVREAAA